MNLKKGVLYMVPCPIGDNDPVEVLPASVINTVKELDYFIVENVRTARRFLSKVRIGKPIESLRFEELNEHTDPQRLSALLGPLLEGCDAGVISEAGVPGIADPGADLVMECHRRNIKVVPLTGPSSILLSMMASGMNGQSFAFNGYLPVKDPERTRAIRFYEKRALSESQSQAFIETPYRNIKLFEQLLAVCSANTMLCVACDLQQAGEFIHTATISEWKRSPKPDLHKKPTIFILN